MSKSYHAPEKFSEERLLNILRAPLITEKATRAAEDANNAVFEVSIDATKQEIKAAVESLFKVEVVGVRTALTKGKSKRFGRSMGKRKDTKKAYVRVAAGQEIDFVGSV